MTRKDFERIAAGLAKVRAEMAKAAFRKVCLQMAYACQDCARRRDSFHFDKFIAACNGERL